MSTFSEKTALAEVDAKDGKFKRTPSSYRHVIHKTGDFPPDKNRYILYVSLACPWACRCVATYYLKGLEDVISLSVVHPVWARTREEDMHCGWRFASPDDPPVSNPKGYGSFPCDGCIPDPLGSFKFVRDMYDEARDTKYTVPVLFDSVTKTIVNNESSDIMRMLNASFNDHAKNPGLDLYPEDCRAAIDVMNESIYESVNNGVYKCGFATTQSAYDEAVTELFESLERIEQTLTKSRYLCGDVLTEADVRLFCTLIRFDPVYVVYFKTNVKTLHEFPSIREYVKDVYSIPEVQKSVDMDHIKMHYFASHPTQNPYAIIPRGPFPAWWTCGDHNRHKMTKQAVSWTV